MPLTLPQSFSDVLDYRHILLKRKWTILLSTALVLLFTSVRVARETPVYYSSAQLMLSHEPPSALNLEDIFQQNPFRMQPQRPDMSSMALLSSRMLAERVIKKLNLGEDPGFLAPPRPSLQTSIGRLVPSSLRKKIKGLFSREKDRAAGEAEASDPSAKIQWLVNDYISALKVFPTETGLVQVNLTGADRARLRGILDTHLKEFVKLDLELKFETSGEAGEWIEEKLEEAKHRLERSQLALLKFAEENELPPVDEAFGPPEDFGAQEQKVAEYKQAIQSREVAMQLLGKLLQDPDIIEGLPDMREESPLLDKLKSEYLQMSAQYGTLSTRYGPDHPNMVRARNQIASMKQQIREEAQRLLRSMKTQNAFYEGMLAKAAEDQAVMMKDVQRRADLSVQFQSLKSEVESNRKVYEEVLAKLNLVKLMGNLKDDTLMSTIKVIDAPQPAMLLGGGSKMGKLARALGMGLFLGVAVAFLLEFLDNVVRSPKDIQRFLSLPFLGFVPSLTSAQMKDGPRGGRSFVTILDPSSSEAESLRNVRTNLIFSFADRKNHAVLFTSPNPMEGKSTVISQLAASISQLGKKTLLVDTDLRRPTLHKIVRFENRSGVSDILIGETTLDQAIHDTGIPNLDFLCAGTIPPNPSELLGSESMRSLIQEMKSRYDLVLFDSPPILPVVDAKVLGSLVDGVCIVPRSGQTTLPSLNMAVQQMQERTIKILGVVLNHLDMAAFATQYGYTYGYYQSREDGAREEEVALPSAAS